MPGVRPLRARPRSLGARRHAPTKNASGHGSTTVFVVSMPEMAAHLNRHATPPPLPETAPCTTEYGTIEIRYALRRGRAADPRQRLAGPRDAPSGGSAASGGADGPEPRSGPVAPAAAATAASRAAGIDRLLQVVACPVKSHEAAYANARCVPAQSDPAAPAARSPPPRPGGPCPRGPRHTSDITRQPGELLQLDHGPWSLHCTETLVDHQFADLD